MKKEEVRKKIRAGKLSAESLLGLSAKTRKDLLLKLGSQILKNSQKIIAANQKDIKRESTNKAASFLERLSLDENKVRQMADSVKQIALGKDVLFTSEDSWKGPSGITIEKKIFPLGLIAIIYESRPNVTMDAFSLAFKSGNALILKGGREIVETNAVLIGVIRKTLGEFNINENIIQDLSGIERNDLDLILKSNQIDCLIPRGGKALIEKIRKDAMVPVIITGASVVHAYVDESANLSIAERVIVNAKTRRVSICNALDVLLIHEKVYKKVLEIVAPALEGFKVLIKGDEKVYSFLKKAGYPYLKKAGKEDYDTEFLDYILAIKVVKNLDEALEHIKAHSLGHSETIITKSENQAKRFFTEIDSACLYWNTSTQFSDGGEFGMGGEMGISTQKLHARGPFAYRELTTYKYLVKSRGKVRD